MQNLRRNDRKESKVNKGSLKNSKAEIKTESSQF